MSDPKHAAPPAPDVPLNSAAARPEAPPRRCRPRARPRAGRPAGGCRGPGVFVPHHALPPKAARAFLNGSAPGVQQSYAPNAETSTVEGWVEDDETVERLARWRRDAPYG